MKKFHARYIIRDMLYVVMLYSKDRGYLGMLSLNPDEFKDLKTGTSHFITWTKEEPKE